MLGLITDIASSIMKKINLKKISKPIKIKMKQYFDNRGFFQEIFLKKAFNDV